MGVTVGNNDILEVEPYGRISTEIGMRAAPGLVPLYMVHQARVRAGYTLPAWDALDYWDRVIEVTMYLLNLQVEAHRQGVQAREADKASKRAKKGRK